VKDRLLELLAAYFCVRTNDAASLLRERAPTETDERSVRRTLGLLAREGYVCQLDAGGSGVKRHVFGLSDKGVAQAFAVGYSTEATKTLDEHSLRTIDHELAITDFHIALERLAAQRCFRCTWRQTDLKHTVHPDALFTIEDPLNADHEFCYFLEIEHSKYGNYRNGEPQIIRKLGAYYEYFNSAECEREWGFRQYRVVIVQKTEARREGLLKILRQKFPHRMFLLATEDAVRNSFGCAILMTARDSEPIPFFTSR
jgi:hypothetical protein